MTFNPEVIQVVIQGGAVGLLLAFGYLGYKLANRIISAGMTIIGNHMAHVEQALVKVEKTLTRLDETIERIVSKE